MSPGGATGIGFAIASELLDADANVIILGRREEKLKEAISKLGEHCSYYVFDITDTAHYDKLISKIETTTPIDILVNNAGINNKKDYFDFTEEELDTIIATQAKAPFLFSQAVAVNMKNEILDVSFLSLPLLPSSECMIFRHILYVKAVSKDLREVFPVILDHMVSV